MIKSIFPNKSWKLPKIIIAVGKLFSSCAHSWWGFTEGVLQVILFKVLCFRWPVKNTLQQRFYKEFERDFNMKIIVTIIPSKLVTSLLLSLFCPFTETKN